MIQNPTSTFSLTLFLISTLLFKTFANSIQNSSCHHVRYLLDIDECNNVKIHTFIFLYSFSKSEIMTGC